MANLQNFFIENQGFSALLIAFACLFVLWIMCKHWFEPLTEDAQPHPGKTSKKLQTSDFQVVIPNYLSYASGNKGVKEVEVIYIPTGEQVYRNTFSNPPTLTPTWELQQKKTAIKKMEEADDFTDREVIPKSLQLEIIGGRRFFPFKLIRKKVVI